jgi:glycosyltransferase 2 family protein
MTTFQGAAGAWRPRTGALVMSVLLLGGVTVVLALHVSFAGEMWKTVATLPLSSLVIAQSLNLAQLGLQTLRLWALIPRRNPVPVGDVAYAFSIGTWVNILVPLRAGDAVKAVLLTRADGARRLDLTQATGAVLADKVVDVGSMILLCAVGGLIGVLSQRAWAGAPRLLTAVVALGGILLAVVLILRLVRPEWLGRPQEIGREMLRGASALRDPLMGSTSLALSLGVWVAELLAVQVLTRALGFSLPLPRVLLALVLLNIGISVPISVANVGPYEAALAFGLKQSGVPLASGLVLAAVHHLLELLAISVVSAALWVRANAAQSKEFRPSPQA